MDVDLKYNHSDVEGESSSRYYRQPLMRGVTVTVDEKELWCLAS